MKGWKLAAILLPLLLVGGVTVKRGPGQGGGGGVPGLTGGVGNESTVNYLMDLKAFEALPELATYYFSADANAGCDPVLTGSNAGTCLPAGLDANDCTAESPCLTMTRCLALSTFGGVRCVFDSLDAWDVPGDETGANVYILATTAVCPDTDEACIVWGGSDRTGGDPAVFDCLGMFGAAAMGAGSDGMFRDPRTVSGGYWAFENLRLTNCPNELTAPVDIVRVDGPGDVVMLNVQVTELQGNNNEYYTSHNTTAGGFDNQSEFVAINPFCHVFDWVNGVNEAAKCLFSLGNQSTIVIGGEFSSSDDSATGAEVLMVAFDGGAGATPLDDLTVIGTTFRNRDAASGGQTTVGIDAQPGDLSVANLNVFYSTFVGFAAIAGDRPIDFGIAAGVEGATSNLYLYKNSFGITRDALGGTINTVTGNTTTIRGGCNAFDGQTISILNLAGADCSPVNIQMDQIVADETVGFPYNIEGVTFATGALLETGSVTRGCGGAPWTWNSTADTTPFGVLLEAPSCRDTSCQNACTLDGSVTFPNGGQIPRFVVGERINGFRFSKTSHIGR